MYFFASDDYAQKAVLLGAPRLIREELLCLQETLQEAGEKLCFLKKLQKDVAALAATHPCRAEELSHLLARIEGAEEEFCSVAEECETRAEELAESLAWLGLRRKGGMTP